MASKRELLQQAQKRLTKAKRGRDIHQPRIDDILRFMQPWRMRHYDTRPNVADFDELFDSTGQDVLADFAADMGAHFTPMSEQWIDIQPAKRFTDGENRQIKEQLDRYRDVVFDHIQRSNFQEAAQESYPDLFAGTMAMLIEDIDPAEPIHCEAVPLPDLLIDRAPRGRGVGPRFRHVTVRAEDVKVIWPDAELPEWLESRAKSAPESEVAVTWGLWRDHSEDVETWQFLLWTGGHQPSGSDQQQNRGGAGEVLLERKLQGKGSCPLIVARWQPDGVTAYGVGPGHKALPNVKTVNKTKELTLRNADLAVDPPFAYDNDGVLNFQHGIEPGMGYARMPGSKIDTIEPQRRFDVAQIVLEDERMAIMRAGFQDKPHQAGKTPPTATQFLEEQELKAQRMGAPAGRLITEWQLPIFQRFAYLLEQRGELPPVELNGERVALKPVSRLTKQQQSGKALAYTRYAETITNLFGPQAAAAILDTFGMAKDLADFMGVDQSRVRDPNQLQGLLDQFGGTGLLGGGGQ